MGGLLKTEMWESQRDRDRDGGRDNDGWRDG